VQSGRSLNSDHRRHDRLLIARFAADDAYPGEVDEARELVEACSDCEALAADIRSLSVAMAQLPDARRTRDFRLSPEQADRLRGSWLERLMRTLAAPSLGMLRPVAGVAMSIGLAMVIIGSLPLGMPAAGTEDRDMMMQDVGAPAAESEAPAISSDAPVPQQTLTPGGPVAVPPETTQPDDPADAPPETEAYPLATSGSSSRADGSPPAIAAATEEPVTDNMNNAYVPDEPAAGDGEASGDDARGAETLNAASPRTGDMLITVGLVLAIAGLLLLAVIWFARRRFRDPLLG
jgi:hypothetical protein